MKQKKRTNEISSLQKEENDKDHRENKYNRSQRGKEKRSIKSKVHFLMDKQNCKISSQFHQEERRPIFKTKQNKKHKN